MISAQPALLSAPSSVEPSAVMIVPPLNLSSCGLASGVSVIALLVATEIRRQLPSAQALKGPQVSKEVS